MILFFFYSETILPSLFCLLRVTDNFRGIFNLVTYAVELFYELKNQHDRD